MDSDLRIYLEFRTGHLCSELSIDTIKVLRNVGKMAYSTFLLQLICKRHGQCIIKSHETDRVLIPYKLHAVLCHNCNRLHYHNYK